MPYVSWESAASLWCSGLCSYVFSWGITWTPLISQLWTFIFTDRYHLCKSSSANIGNIWENYKMTLITFTQGWNMASYADWQGTLKGVAVASTMVETTSNGYHSNRKHTTGNWLKLVGICLFYTHVLIQLACLARTKTSKGREIGLLKNFGNFFSKSSQSVTCKKFLKRYHWGMLRQLLLWDWWISEVLHSSKYLQIFRFYKITVSILLWQSATIKSIWFY